ncbi:DUF1353 domain-containing protein [Cognatishimia sp. MH4019]|uniref:DUF1353 domain-containing protein n=1 Tax=Cognatishimia sp. MH4019 TaxID=2854030 RepID=UPI001CD2CAE3|nr:DUF1353 domain-containing protein [Cognatishimia sp. MH4019]
MSSFTQPLIVTAVQGKPSGWRRVLPPGMQRPRWKIWIGFEYAVGDLENPTEVIKVPGSFVFDGASVPLPFRMLVPMAHPDYIQAAALHDWMLESGRHSRRYCDQVFYEALGVLGIPRFWRLAMFWAVRLGAVRWHARRIIQGVS